MRAPERAETKAVELATSEYLGDEILSVRMSDGSIKGLAVNDESITLSEQQITLHIPDDCSGNVECYDVSSVEDDFVIAEIGWNTCEFVQGNGIVAGIQIKIGDVLFVRPAVGFITPNDFLICDISEFIKK